MGRDSRKRSNLKKSIFSYGIIQNMQNLLGKMTKIGRSTDEIHLSVFCFLVLYDYLYQLAPLNIKEIFSFDMIYFPVTGKSIS